MGARAVGSAISKKKSGVSGSRAHGSRSTWKFQIIIVESWMHFEA